ncbi:MAG: STT3 domain-containing protein, partial [Candidatus Woesearchaeota archaeon]
APFGTPTAPDFYTSVSAFLYKTFVKPFSSISAYKFFLYIPAIFVILTVIVAFLIGYLFYDLKTGFMYSLFIGLNTFILSRTMGGAPDNDAPNFLFSLLVVLFSYLAYNYRRELKKLIIFSALFGLSLYFFTLQWPGWWYIFDVIIIAFSLNFLFLLFVKFYKKTQDKKVKIFDAEIKQELIYLAFILISASIFLAFNKLTIFNAIQGALWGVREMKGVGYSIWPNVYTTVAELNEGSLDDVLNSLFNKNYFSAATNMQNLGKFYSFFFISILFIGIFVLIYLSIRYPEKDYHFVLFIAIAWLGSMGYATLKGIRFNIYVVPAYALIVSIGISFLINLLNDILFRKDKEVFKYLRFLISSFVIVSLVLFPMYANASFLAANHLPMYTGGWDRSMKYIRENSAKDAIIDSWWDFGHWFKAMAERRVTFDGASQNTPMAHWMGKALLTNDYKLSVKILKMLSCGSNRAFELIDKKLNDSYESIVLLYNLLNSKRTEYRKILKERNFSEKEIDEILNYFDCENPPEKYFITSEDMVGKSGVWAHFGIWDFYRAKIWLETRNLNFNQIKNHLITKYNFSVKEASTLASEIEKVKSSKDVDRVANSWIAPWPSYFGNTFDCKLTNLTLSCPIKIGFNQNNNQLVIDSFVYNFENASGYYNAYISNTKGYSQVSLVPKRIFDGRNVYYNESGFEIGVIIMNNKIMLSDYNLVDSVFTRLFYFEETQPYFEKVYSDFAVGTGKVIVWKVNYSSIE